MFGNETIRQVRKAIVLAAGKGKRMGVLTKSKPKPLLKVGGKTFLDHIFNVLPHTVTEVVVVIGYGGKQIQRYLGRNYKGRKITYVWQKKLTGTAFAFLLTKDCFNVALKERFFIFYADEFATRQEIKKCLSYEFSWLCHRVSGLRQTGVVELSKDRRIVRVRERPKKFKSDLAAGGVMIVNSDLFKYRPVRHNDGEYYLTSMLNKFLKTHNVYAVIGRPDLYFAQPADIDKFDKRV